MTECCNTILYNVAYARLKTIKNFKLLALKVDTVAYERCSLARGSKYGDLTWKLLDFLENWSLRRGDNLLEVVAARGSTVTCDQAQCTIALMSSYVRAR